ncbi:hypothetical protein DO97_05955 [Neosynechococcus sphagnicola sy1]|uniref:DUF3007 domain-containing protein n=1 Tax=Neosynechococcus sphagnicola sy1 TaxID=1497020 RepID=A0A098TSY8_9CYAN|nr:DUF3007 family protein [Neosynechococcus sphagnicola]KGF73893.1 hypothetical protein DO97_05955 [Neosynechococcus sphagnicola sy1]
MRKIDVILIGLGAFAAGGLLYWTLQLLGLNSQSAGIWSQGLLVMGLMGWVLTYLFRVSTHRMTYNQQLKNYEDAVLQKRFAELSPAELAQLQAEIIQEKQQAIDADPSRGNPS